MTLRRGRTVTAAVLGCFALLYLAEAWKLTRGTLSNPGPGLFPLVVGSLLLVSAVGVLSESLLPGSQGTAEEHADGSVHGRGLYVRLALVAAVSVGYVALLPLLGLALTGAGAAYAVMLVGRVRRKVVGLIISVALGVLAQYCFVDLLHVPLPATAFLP